MNATPAKSPLPRLLSSIRRRLWLDRILADARTAIWIVGPSCIVTGVIHRWLWAIPPVVSLLVVLTPGLLLMVRALLVGSPSLRRCARVADRLLGTQELITSAVELASESGQPGRSARIVMNRAARTASEAPDVVLPSRRYAAPIVPVILTFVGTFLLVNAGAEPGDNSATAFGAPVTSRRVSALLSVDPNRSNTFRRDDRERPTVENEGLVLPDAFDDEGPTPLIIPDLAATSAVRPGRRPPGQLATDGRPASRPGLEPSESPAMEIRLVHVSMGGIALPDAPGSTASALDSDADDGLGSTVQPGATPRSVALQTWNRLDVADRRLVDRYFARLRTDSSDREVAE